MTAGRSLLLALVFLTAPLVGCIGTETAPVETASTDLAAELPDVSFDAAATLEELTGFVKTYSHRNYDGPEHQGARDYLAGELESLGLEVHRQGFEDPEEAPFVDADVPMNVHLENIIGIQWGEDRHDWVVVGAHYDTVVQAVEGAYDDGSGTMLTMNLARALADVDTERTIAYVLFDGEERGLKGSRYFSDSITGFFDEVDAEPFTYQPNLTAMVNLDMFGINYPAEPPIFFDENSPEIRQRVLAKADELEMPEDSIHCTGISAGRSDYASFEDAGIPIAFFISDFEDVRWQGQQLPGEYPFWHQADTVETMETMAGGPEMLEDGFQTALDLSGDLLIYLADQPGLTLTLQTDDEAPDPKC